MAILTFSLSMKVCTVRMSVKGGCTETSTTSWSSLVSRYRSLSRVAVASKWLRFIFQLPEMSGLRSGIRCSSEGLQAGEVAVLEQLERRTPAGGDVIDAVGDAELVGRRGGVPAADDREAAGVGEGLGHHLGAGGEAGVLEDAHRSVPEHGAGLGDDVAELGGGAGADVEA